MVGISAMLGSVLLTGSIAETYTQPAMAVRLFPWNATALAQSASETLQSAQAKDAPAATALAMRSLALQPDNPVAARTLGLAQVLGGDIARGGRSIHYAEALSRRDVPTQLWLIEEAVTAGDVPSVLQHYNRALSTSESIGDTLLPVLIAACSTPAVAKSLGIILAKRPVWWRAFVERLVTQYPSPEAVATLLHAVRLDKALPEDQALLVRASQRLVASGREDLARSLLSIGRSTQRDVVMNGNFELDPGLPPFDWSLADTGEFGAEIQSAANGRGRSLFLRSQNATAGELAREFISLRPGQRYRFGLTYGDMPESGGITVSVSCIGGRQILLTVAIPKGSGRAESDLTAPAECHGQWLIVGAEPRFDTTSGTVPWIDDVTIQPVR